MLIHLPSLHFAEGYFTIDVLWRLLRCTLFDPVLTFLLPLYQLQRLTRILTAKSALHAMILATRAIEWKRDVWSNPWMIASLIVWGGGIGYRLNEELNRGVRNNFRTNRDGWNDWKGRVVVITGGAGGLGKEVIKQLRARKLEIKIVVLDLADYNEPLPQEVSQYKIDITNAEAIKEAAAQIQREIGHPTVLVNMAGIVRAKSILDMSQKDIDLTYDVNVKSHYYLVQAFLPEMLKTGIGHVVTIASSTGYHQAANGVAYCSSKAAALSFHEGLTEELRYLYQPAPNARRIRTSIICPAHIKTKMFEGFASSIPSFLAPSLEVSTVAQLVTQTVLSGESQHIIEPVYAKFTPMARGLPTWIYAFILACARKAMGGVKEVQQKLEKAE
ncbi:SDR family oxidoreductase [Sporobolomyces koalae]|uniref:SDR family oxidoreductase n=1 Tax=Sporobolomyces koalae TaxID=500713 RepID=UPI00317DA108